MATLSEEKIEAAAKIYQDEVHRGTPGILGWDECSFDDQKDIARCLRAAAPFLQLSWDEPTEGAIGAAAIDLFGSSRNVDLLVTLDVCKQFVRRRNAALLPNPVDPRTKAIRKAMEGTGIDLSLVMDRILAALDEVK